MVDIEKVMSWLEGLSQDDWQDYHSDSEVQNIAKEALELLKEQEEKQTPKPIIHGPKEEYWGEEEICPVCGKRWQSAYIDSTHFCPGCGQAVIWENT